MTGFSEPHIEQISCFIGCLLQHTMHVHFSLETGVTGEVVSDCFLFNSGDMTVCCNEIRTDDVADAVRSRLLNGAGLLLVVVERFLIVLPITSFSVENFFKSSSTLELSLISFGSMLFIMLKRLVVDVVAVEESDEVLPELDTSFVLFLYRRGRMAVS